VAEAGWYHISFCKNKYRKAAQKFSDLPLISHLLIKLTIKIPWLFCAYSLSYLGSSIFQAWPTTSNEMNIQVGVYRTRCYTKWRTISVDTFRNTPLLKVAIYRKPFSKKWTLCAPHLNSRFLYYYNVMCHFIFLYQYNSLLMNETSVIPFQSCTRFVSVF
jgi:hypothetical protein